MPDFYLCSLYKLWLISRLFYTFAGRSFRMMGRLFATIIIVGIISIPFRETVAQSLNVIRDAEAEYVIRLYSTPLFKAAGIPPDAVQILLVNDRTLNAFVSPGLYMVLHSGLLNAADTAEQIIGVIAHEAGHIAAGHLIRLQDNLEEARIVTLASMALGLIAGALTQRGDVASAVIAGGSSTAQRGLFSHTRANENEADQIGLRLLTETNQSAQGLLQFFAKLGYQEALTVDSAYVDPYVRTHPLSRERRATVRDFVERSPLSKRKPDRKLNQLLKRVQAKLRAFMDPPARVRRRYPITDVSIPAQYARAILHLRQGDRAAGIPAIDKLIRQEPKNPFFHELRGQLLFETGQINDALPSLERAVTLAPREPLLRILYAHALVEAGTKLGYKKALLILNPALRKHRELSFGWRLAAQAYYHLGEEGMAAYADAEYNFRTEDLERAEISAGRALEKIEQETPRWYEAQLLMKKIQQKIKKLQ